LTEQHEWRPFRHMIAWGVIALIAVVAIFTTIGLLFYYFPPAAPAGAVYPYYGFFGFRILFGFFILFAAFWFLRFVFWGGWGWGHRRAYYGGYGYWRHHDSSYYILRERYARGEITKDQYDQMIRDLDQHATPA
jgi:putative membrane protein